MVTLAVKMVSYNLANKRADPHIIANTPLMFGFMSQWITSKVVHDLVDSWRVNLVMVGFGVDKDALVTAIDLE